MSLYSATDPLTAVECIDHDDDPETAALIADFLADVERLADRFETMPDPRTSDTGAAVF